MGVHTQIRQSDRNRPTALRNPTTERAGGAVELIGRYLPPMRGLCSAWTATVG